VQVPFLLRPCGFRTDIFAPWPSVGRCAERIRIRSTVQGGDGGHHKRLSNLGQDPAALPNASAAYFIAMTE
jgi:hypothetical protein